MPNMKNWKFISAVGTFMVPEVKDLDEFRNVRLFGKVYDDPRKEIISSEFADGHRVITSPIREINIVERTVRTRSGTVYKLDGRPDNSWTEWLSEFEDFDEKYSELLFPLGDIS